jgi:hypothetical protein
VGEKYDIGFYGLVYYLRFLVTRNLLLHVSAVLTEAEHLLDRAESISVIPRPNDYRSPITLYESVVPCHLTVTSLIVAVIPINFCGFGWKAIVLLEYYSNFSMV